MCVKSTALRLSSLDREELKALGIPKGLVAIKSTSGATMDPYELAKDLLQYCSSRGLTIYDRTEVTEIQQDEDYITLKTSSGFTIRTQHVFHCTGYESVQTVEEDIVKLKSTYAMASEALQELPKAFKENIFWNTDEPYLYFRATKDNRIIMGGGDDDFKNAKAT